MGTDAYEKMKFLGASPGELLVLLYEGLVQKIEEATQALKDNDPKVAGPAISRAVDIVGHLRASLAKKAAPELVAKLDVVYKNWSVELVKANAKKNAERLQEIKEQVEELLDAWKRANKRVR